MGNEPQTAMCQPLARDCQVWFETLTGAFLGSLKVTALFPQPGQTASRNDTCIGVLRQFKIS